MSLPHVLLVDDSDAVLAYEEAALAGRFVTSRATNGAEALRKARAILPAAILLDLSMPEMDGDEVLAAMQADPALADIPVLVVSSEHGRADACLARGAVAFLPKPVRGPELVAAVDRALDAVDQERKKGGLAVLPIGVGPYDLALPLDAVETVALMPATRPLAGGPIHARSYVELHGERLVVLDLAARLGVAHAVRVLDRRLVVCRAGEAKVALCVDRVRDPEELAAAAVQPGVEPAFGLATLAVAVTSGGSLPVVEPGALLTELAALVRAGEAAWTR